MDVFKAIIPVKKNSSRLPNKNILPFGDSNLLVHKIRQLKKVKYIDEIIVSSDSDYMLELADNEGVTSMLRPKQYADESLPICEFITWLGENISCDHFLWACATSPLVNENLYEKAIETYLTMLDRGYDSLVTVLPFQHYLMDENGPYNFKRGKNHTNSQQLKELYLFTNGIQLTPHDKYIEWGDRIGEHPFLMKIGKNESIDIDDIYDYQFAQSIYEKEEK